MKETKKVIRRRKPNKRDIIKVMIKLSAIMPERTTQEEYDFMIETLQRWKVSAK